MEIKISYKKQNVRIILILKYAKTHDFIFYFNCRYFLILQLDKFYPLIHYL